MILILLFYIKKTDKLSAGFISDSSSSRCKVDTIEELSASCNCIWWDVVRKTQEFSCIYTLKKKKKQCDHLVNVCTMKSCINESMKRKIGYCLTFDAKELMLYSSIYI